ncbi:hypothetical protein [Algoriphagus mannitolivorans]|uniref:hypothetical protein n=1 Tax=Algoriphagus mannitolivorans TaxID=226504 RepID=UPI0003FCEE74|nr:hypothetical protein [Algoriphagus mannitolivorans]
MDFGNIIYIVAVIAYFIYQMTKKKGGEELPDSTEPTSQAPQKGVTFDDLLREIREAQNPQRPEPAAPAPKPIPVHERRAIPKKVVEEEEDDETRYYEGTFKANKKIPNQEFADIPSLLKTPILKIEDDPLKPKKVNPYGQKLRNPKSVKEAIVLSEILNRKHF